jgi:hypothetical protein
MSSFIDDTSDLTSLISDPHPEEPENELQEDDALEDEEDDNEAASATAETTHGKKRKRGKTSWVWKHGEEVSVKGIPHWQCSLCPNRTKAQRYKVLSGTWAPAVHLKEKHQVEEEISRKTQRLETHLGHIEHASEHAQRIQKLKESGLPGPGATLQSTARGATGRAATIEWNEETHKALLVRVYRVLVASNGPYLTVE